MDVMDLLKTRRTYRRFLSKEISEEIVQDILEAARLASSAANRQPLKYVVIQGEKALASIFAQTKWAGYLPPEQGVPKEGERPMLYIAVLTDTEIQPAEKAAVDAGLAMSNMTLSAWTHGVGSCIIGAFNRKETAAYLKLPENLWIQNLVAFGYPSHTAFCEDCTGSIRYYLDSDGNYRVPKRCLSETVRYFKQD